MNAPTSTAAGPLKRSGTEPAHADDPLAARLVANSSIQFLDFVVDGEAAGRISRRFYEEPASVLAGTEAELHAVKLEEGVFYHPVTGEIGDPSRTYVVDGCKAIESYLDVWLPLPYMRVIDGGLDEGPSNWARVHISRRASSSPGSFDYHVVLAFDTAIGTDDGPAARAAAPTPADVAGRTRFQLSSDVDAIAWFATEAWVDDWLAESFRTGRPSTVASGAQATSASPTPGLAHLGHYLVLLTVLEQECDLPTIDFLSHAPAGGRTDSIDVDLVLEIGTARTCALLCETGARAPGTFDAAGARMICHLPLRDLSRPWRVHIGCHPSRVTFARASFGSEMFSRWSGRTRAFEWPSLARVGHEASALAANPGQPDALTGLSNSIGYLWDDSPSRAIWRFTEGATQPGTASTQRGTLLSGAMLALLSDDGTPTARSPGAVATTKPRFARSSLMMFAAAELILHAVGAINAPELRPDRADDRRSRRLNRIVVSAPAGLHERERAQLLRRIEDAIEVVWSSMGWNGSPAEPQPERPSALVVCDAAVSLQAAYLENEIAHKLRNQLPAYLELMGQVRPGSGTSPSLRVATLDIGDTTTDVSIATWSQGGKAALSADVELADSFRLAGSDILKAIVERILLPAMEQRLADCKLAEPRLFLEQLFEPAPGQRLRWPCDLGRRITTDILQPAALAILRTHEATDPRAGEILGEHVLSDLLASVGVTARATAEPLDSIAADEGASGFSPLETPVTFLHSDVAAITRNVLGPALSSAVRAIKLLGCDYVLVAGGCARLPVVTDMLLEGLAMRPDRIVLLDAARMEPWYRLRDGNGQVGETKTFAAVGAMLRSADPMRLGAVEVTEHAPDRQRRSVFIGHIRVPGTLAQEDVLFTGGDGGRLQRLLVAELPVEIGVRPTSLESWPARPIWVLERADDRVSSRAKGQLKITVAYAPGSNGGIGTLRLVSVYTADGTLVDPSEVVLRPQTTGLNDGCWLDTGRISIASARA